jgi:hypothetical protein
MESLSRFAGEALFITGPAAGDAKQFRHPAPPRSHLGGQSSRRARTAIDTDRAGFWRAGLT